MIAEIKERPSGNQGSIEKFFDTDKNKKANNRRLPLTRVGDDNQLIAPTRRPTIGDTLVSGCAVSS